MQAILHPLVVSTSSLIPHPFYPDLSVFLTGEWSAGRLYLGFKVTPADKDEDRFIARYYRETDEAIIVEFWQSAGVLEGTKEIVEMSCAEFTWLLGHQVDDLSVPSAKPEFDSDTITEYTLFPFSQVPNAEQDTTGLGSSAVACLASSDQPRKSTLPLSPCHDEEYLYSTIIGPTQAGEETSRREKGKTRESYDLENTAEQPRRSKRKGVFAQECEPGPSKRARTDVPIKHADIAGPSSPGTSTCDSKEAETVDPGRTASGRFRCLRCEETFVAKNVRDRHAESHEPDRIVYVCRGRQSK